MYLSGIHVTFQIEAGAPVVLLNSYEIFNADRPYAGVHRVFEDSLPDDWGRRILARRYQLARNEQRVPQLLDLLGGQGMGALSYSRDDTASIDTKYILPCLQLIQKPSNESHRHETNVLTSVWPASLPPPADLGVASSHVL